MIVNKSVPMPQIGTVCVQYYVLQRCNSKCVSEATFYRLVQSFAVALFE